MDGGKPGSALAVMGHSARVKTLLAFLWSWCTTFLEHQLLGMFQA